MPFNHRGSRQDTKDRHKEDARAGRTTYITGIRQEADEDDGQQEAPQRRGEGVAKKHNDDVLPDQSRRLPRLQRSSCHCADRNSTVEATVGCASSLLSTRCPRTVQSTLCQRHKKETSDRDQGFVKMMKNMKIFYRKNGSLRQDSVLELMHIEQPAPLPLRKFVS